MLTINAENWFSLFRKGIEFFAEMSVLHHNRCLPTVSKKQPCAKALQSTSKVPCNRKILVRKSKASSKLGRAAHRLRAWRPTEHLGMVAQKTLAGCPTRKLAGYLAKYLFSFRCNTQLAAQAMVASEWLSHATELHHMPWYAFIFQSCRDWQGTNKGFTPSGTYFKTRANGSQQPEAMPTRATLPAAQKKSAMVAAAHKGYPGNGVG